jgi:three-Cys-motif partner protein
MGAKARVAHRFGGVWTEIKLKALTEYLDFYQKALKNQGFETWYLDAFAGTGDRHTELEQGGIFEGSPIERVERILDGSARKALNIDPPFTHYWFVEQHRGRASVLEKLKQEFELDIVVRRGEANSELSELFGSFPWVGSRASKQRGVVFLDPYGMTVGWDTLKLLAAARRVDVWYLFPRKAVVQQLAHDIRGIDDAKRKKLAEIFGGDDWEKAFYDAQPVQGGLFDTDPAQTKGRTATPAQIANFARQRLGKLFCYVSDPLPLIVQGRDFFELYCLSNNPRAIPLIQKGVDHVMRKYTPASHRRSAHLRGDR